MVLTILFRRLRFFLRTFARTIFAVLPSMVFAGILHHAFKRLKEKAVFGITVYGKAVYGKSGYGHTGYGKSRAIKY